MRSAQLYDSSGGDEPVGWQAGVDEQAAARLALFQDSGLDGRHKLSRTAETREAQWPLADETVQAQRKALLELAQATIRKENDSARLREDMIAFEQRAQTTGLDPSEVSETYRQAARLLKPADKTPVAARDLTNVAQQIVHQAAHPTSIDQGKHATCNVAALEVRIYSRTPSKAAQLVADIATTGRFLTKDGTPITLHADSYKPDDESKKNPIPDNQRSMASQLFEITAANVHWFRADHDFWGKPIPKGTVGFAQIESQRGARIQQEQIIFDTGERLIDMNRTPPAAVLANPGIRVGHLFGINEQITGKAESGFIIENSVLGAQDTAHVSSKQELGDALLAVKNADDLPALLRVHSGNRPFNKHPGNWHFVNIVDIDPASGKIRISNQLGADSDRTVEIDELYQATLPPKGENGRPDEFEPWHPILDPRRDGDLRQNNH